MTDRDKNDDSFFAPGSGEIISGQIIVPDDDILAPEDDPNGPVPDDEEDHESFEDDQALLDSGESPEFDHSLRRPKQ